MEFQQVCGKGARKLADEKEGCITPLFKTLNIIIIPCPVMVS